MLDRLLAALQKHRLIRVRVECLGLDSTSVKDHPDGTGARKKRASGHRKISRRREHQGSSGSKRMPEQP